MKNIFVMVALFFAISQSDGWYAHKRFKITEITVEHFGNQDAPEGILRTNLPLSKKSTKVNGKKIEKHTGCKDNVFIKWDISTPAGRLYCHKLCKQKQLVQK